jgi:serine protease AprX
MRHMFHGRGSEPVLNPTFAGGECRSCALWGAGGRRGGGRLAVLALALAVVLGTLFGTARVARAAGTAYVPAALVEAATAKPDASFALIVEGAPGVDAHGVGEAIKSTRQLYPGGAAGIERALAVINADAAELSGRQLIALAQNPSISAITRDYPVVRTGFSNKQKWPGAALVSSSWLSAAKGLLNPPAIAVVDSGVDSSHDDLKDRVVKQVTVTTLQPNSSGDGRGHGTFVAGIAAGADTGFTGAVPNAPIVSLDVLDDNGVGMVSDVIAAAEWILRNKAAYNIRVANFSLNGNTPASFLRDPLDKAVEKLWLNGVVVVTAAGNYAQNGQPSGVLFAPANDPFVITAGASDTFGDTSPSNDLAAPWSAYGYTPDGFFKPELAAPGRYLNGPVPPAARMLAEHPERAVAPGYMWMSGTSFAAPVVSGAAAYLLALNPSWTPDQVKGALMKTVAVPAGYGSNGGLGVGVLQADYALFTDGLANPNVALNRYVKKDPSTGLNVFDAAAWQSAASGDGAWQSAAWGSAAWGSAAWSSAAWGSAAWSSAAWQSAAWESLASTTAAWSSAAWANLTWLD